MCGRGKFLTHRILHTWIMNISATLFQKTMCKTLGFHSKCISNRFRKPADPRSSFVMIYYGLVRVIAMTDVSKCSEYCGWNESSIYDKIYRMIGCGGRILFLRRYHLKINMNIFKAMQMLKLNVYRDSLQNTSIYKF